MNPVVWGKLSEESKTLMTSLLNKVSQQTLFFITKLLSHVYTIVFAMLRV